MCNAKNAIKLRYSLHKHHLYVNVENFMWKNYHKTYNKSL